MTAFKRISKILNEILSVKGALSSKRVAGMSCISVYIGLLIGTFLGLEITEIQATLLNGLLTAGIILLGAGVLDRIGSPRYESYGRINDNPNNMEENG